MADAKKLEEITGTIQHLKCQRPTFCAGHIHVGGEQVSFSVKGYVKSGDCVTLRGTWEEHEKWGRQFKAREADISLPTDPAGLAKWLEWNVTSVGPVTAQRLVDEFGVELMDRCASDPQAVAIFARLPIATVEHMASTWVTERARVGALTYFAALGLTKRQCEALVETIPTGSVQLVQDDPFQLIGRVEGFGWSVVDFLAKSLNVTGADPRRLKGALAAIVREQHDEGSTCIGVARACQLAAEKLVIRDPSVIAGVVAAAVERGDVVRFGGGTDDTDYLATPSAHRCETLVWQRLEQMKADHNPYGYADEAKARDYAERYRTMSGLTFDDSQLEAIVNAIRYRVSVVTGSAGSGKTSLAQAIVKFFTDGDVPVRLAAPTGKAARRMQEVIGRHAETIHRLLEYNGGTNHFQRDRLDPLIDSAIIIDEASMLSIELFYRIIVAMGPNTCLILIGDPNQLPPIDAGAPLRDILEHNLAPATRLEKSHRQAGYLKTNCTAILSGKVEPSVTHENPFPWVKMEKAPDAAAVAKVVTSLYEKYLPEWGYDPILDVQFMSAKHEGMYGTKRLNLILQHLHQNTIGNALDAPTADAHEERATIRVGDKVVQERNDYELVVMNGEIGVVTAVQPTYETNPLDLFEELDEVETRRRGDKPYADLIVQFTDREVVYPVGKGGSVALAYCLSVHRMQGSQNKCAVFICPKAHAFMQTRSLLYTACTRAQKTAVIIGDPDGIRRAAEKTETDKRQTIMRVLSRCPEARPAPLWEPEPEPAQTAPAQVEPRREDPWAGFEEESFASFPRMAAFLARGRLVTVEIGDFVYDFRERDANHRAGAGPFVVFRGPSRRDVAPIALVENDGETHRSATGRMTAACVAVLEEFDADPAAFVLKHRGARNWCCFCRQKLTCPISVAVGYGPDCARNRGLPHDQATADSMGKKWD